MLNDGSPHLLYCSTYKLGPVLLDLRAGSGSIHELNVHRGKSVYSMATHAHCDYVYSIGEDNRLVSVDKRMMGGEGGRRAVVAEWGPGSKDRSKLSHVACNRGYLAVSQRSGAAHLRNPTTLEAEEVGDRLCIEIQAVQNRQLSVDFTSPRLCRRGLRRTDATSNG